MALPVYGTNIITIAVGNINTDVGVWDESSDAAWDDGGAPADDILAQYINANAVSAQHTKTGTSSIMYEHTTPFTVPTDGAVLVHQMWAAPASLYTKALGGVQVLLGNSFGDTKVYYVGGLGEAPAPKGGFTTWAVDPAQIASATMGTPDGTYDTVGMACGALAQARGYPNIVNAIRYGRCDQVYTLGEVATPAMFSGFAVLDNTSSTRYNLLETVGADSYKQRGLVSLGTVTDPVYFEDSNISLETFNDEFVSANFNKYEVRNNASVVIWNTVSDKAGGTVSKGSFEIIDDGATVEHNSCTFTNKGTYKYGSNATVSNTIHRGCEPVSQLGGTFTGGTIDKAISDVGLYVDNLNLVTGYTFYSDGTGHAVDLGTISSNTSLSWNNQDSGYSPSNGGDEVYGDLALATYTTDESVDITSSNGSPRGACLGNNGLSYYTPDDSDDTLHEYSLSIAGDIKSATWVRSISTLDADTGMKSIRFHPSGLKFYLVSGNKDQVSEWTVPVAWSINGADYLTNSINFDMSTEDGSVRDIEFKDDGTRMWAMGTLNRRVYQYDMNPAWDILSLDYATASKSVALQDATDSKGIAVSQDGKYLYELAQTDALVYQYDIATLYDISTADYATNSVSYAPQGTSHQGLVFNENDSRFYVTADDGNIIYQYDIASSGAGATGGETILVNVATGITLTINVATGASTPTYKNVGGGIVNVVSGQKTLTLTDIPEGTQVTLVLSATRVELQNDSAPANGIITYIHSGGEIIDILLMGLDIDPNLSDIFDLTLPNTDSSIKFQTIDDSNFFNPV